MLVVLEIHGPTDVCHIGIYADAPMLNPCFVLGGFLSCFSTEFASPHSNSLSPNSALASDPITPPPLDPSIFPPLPLPHSNFPTFTELQQSSSQFPFGSNLDLGALNASQSHGFAQSIGLNHDTSAAGTYLGSSFGGSGGDLGAHAGQKRGSNYDGFFEEVKKRKIEPTYNAGSS